MCSVGFGLDDFRFYSFDIFASTFAEPVPNCQAVIGGLAHKVIFVCLVIAIDLDGAEAEIVSRFGSDVTDRDVGIAFGFEIALNGSVDAVAVSNKDGEVLCDDAVYCVECGAGEEVDSTRS